MAAEAAVQYQVAQFYTAVNRLQHGDPAPMLALWSHNAGITHMRPHGGQQRGWAAVRAYREEAARLASVSPAAMHAAPGDQVICVIGDLAYVGGTERVRVEHDGQVREFTPQATNIFHHEGNAWYLVHRQAEGT